MPVIVSSLTKETINEIIVGNGKILDLSVSSLPLSIIKDNIMFLFFNALFSYDIFIASGV